MAATLLPVIPETITVHLGRPGDSAPNVQVNFVDYIKNVASSEIYPTWPEAALRANILAQISYALNRVYTEWYRAQGYDFDITNTTQFDQAYVHGRDVFENISRIVDEIFNNYLRRQGRVEPLFAAFCNGTTSRCEGLSQWGTVELAEQGLDAFEILQHYYGDDIELVTDAPVQDIEESYPGRALRLGMSGNDVRRIQVMLNRIRRNFPLIPEISSPDGVFGVETEAAVRTFQQVFNLAVDGIVGKATWYRIREIYNGVKQLSELQSEGVTFEEIRPVVAPEIVYGTTGPEVAAVQYYLAVIAYFNRTIPLLAIDGIFGEETRDVVYTFQREYGLPVTGEVDAETWYRMTEIYDGILRELPPGFTGERAALYPGVVLKRGAEGEDVRRLQGYLAYIGNAYGWFTPPEVDGVFGPATEEAVFAFQRQQGLTPSGVVGPVTWAAIAYLYDGLLGY